MRVVSDFAVVFFVFLLIALLLLVWGAVEFIAIVFLLLRVIVILPLELLRAWRPTRR